VLFLRIRRLTVVSKTVVSRQVYNLALW
jgi:hypothetical protein